MKFIHQIKTTANKSLLRMQLMGMETRKKLHETSGQFVMEHTVVFVLILVLAGIGLAILAPWLKGTLATQIQDKVTETLNFS